MKLLKFFTWLLMAVVILNGCSEESQNVTQPGESQSPSLEMYASLSDFQKLPEVKKTRDEILSGKLPDILPVIKEKTVKARNVTSTECVEVLFEGDEEYLAEYDGITFSPELYIISYYAKQWQPVTITFPKAVTNVTLIVWGATILYAYDSNGELIGSSSYGGEWETLAFTAPADRLIKSIVVHDYLGLYYDWFMSRMTVCYYWNEAPVADAGVDQTIESSEEISLLTLDGSASVDPDGDYLTYSWTLDGNEISTEESPTIDLGAGTYTFSLTVTDPSGLSSSDNVTITILSDTQPPVINFELITNSLWPVNHEMILVAAGISASDDNCEATLSVEVTSNEAINDLGNGNTDPDWEVVENNDGSFDVYLRAERIGNGNGRIYTITVTADDCAGNIITQTEEVAVPKNQSSKKKK